MLRNLFLRFKEVHHPHHISSIDAAKRAVAIARGNYFAALCINYELRGLDDLAAVFPPRPQQIGGLTGKPKTDGKVYHVGDFLRLVQRIDARRDNFHTDTIELVF